MLKLNAFAVDDRNAADKMTKQKVRKIKKLKKTVWTSKHHLHSSVFLFFNNLVSTALFLCNLIKMSKSHK